jgi:hypothetical protein
MPLSSIVTAVGWTCLTVATSILVAAQFAPAVDGRLDPREIRAERGHAFIAPVTPRVPRLYSVRGSDVGARKSGPMTFAENGIALGPDDASHDSIRNSGMGAYSHWVNSLYFSSSDGSDPRTNGRGYTYRVRAGLKPSLAGMGIGAAVLGLLCLAWSGRLREPRDRHAHDAEARQPLLIWRAGSALIAAGVVWLAGLAVAAWIRPLEKLSLDAAKATHAAGHAYYAPLPALDHWPWRPALAATPFMPARPPQLLENEARIGLFSPLVLDVVRSGEGTFAHSEGLLAFSSSDRTDPRTNGRRYVLETSMEPATGAWILGLGAMLAGLALFLWRGGNRLGKAFCHFGPAHASDRQEGRAALVDYSLMSLAVLAAVSVLVLNWWGGSSGTLSVASYFPVSDAFGYYQCALSIGVADTPNAAGLTDWCSRRALYPAMLGSLLALSGWRPSIALVLQAALIGLAAGVFLLALQRLFGWVTALLSALGILIIAREFSLGNFMTESLGLTAGLVGLGLLLLSLRRREPNALPFISGLALISVGMALRLGAVFVIPTLAFWAFYATRTMAWRTRWRILLASGAALSLGGALHLLVVYAHEGDASNTGGNFAVVLYGLSTGTRDWSQAHRDFAPLFATRAEGVVYKQIRDVAVTNIRARPQVFFRSIAAAGVSFGGQLFAIGPMGELNMPLTALFVLGIGVCLLHLRHPAFSLLLAVALGELLSAPLVFDSAGHRVLVVTAAARVAMAGLALGWLVRAAVELRRPAASDLGPAPAAAADGRIRVAAVGLAATLVLLAIFLATPLAEPFRLRPAAASGLCRSDELEVVTRLGSETSQLTFGENRLPLFGESLGVASGRLEADPASRGAWWLAQLQLRSPGTTLVYAVQRAGRQLGSIFPAFSTTPLDAPSRSLVSLCLRQDVPATVKLGDWNFYRIVQLRVRPE